jgi:hypothetical protein
MKHMLRAQFKAHVGVVLMQMVGGMNLHFSNKFVSCQGGGLGHLGHSVYGILAGCMVWFKAFCSFGSALLVSVFCQQLCTA